MEWKKELGIEEKGWKGKGGKGKGRLLTTVFFQFQLEEKWGIDVQTRPRRKTNIDK